MIADRSIRISADRGGTFCDVYAYVTLRLSFFDFHSSHCRNYPDSSNPAQRKELVVKLRMFFATFHRHSHLHLVSQDPANYRDAPTEGIRRVLEIVTGKAIPRGEKLDITKIGVISILYVHSYSTIDYLLLDYIRLSTTVATNALLERKGRKHALLITKGFKDLLLIGNQSRPKIFDLNIRRPPPLYSTVIEIDERVTLVGYTSDPQAEEHQVLFDQNGKIKRGYRGKGWDGKGDAEGPGRVVQGISGEAVRILKQPGACQKSL
jgi:5-oxoprolinase (ATP-hydrolysing)